MPQGDCPLTWPVMARGWADGCWHRKPRGPSAHEPAWPVALALIVILLARMHTTSRTLLVQVFCAYAIMYIMHSIEQYATTVEAGIHNIMHSIICILYSTCTY